jgi:hypothetical protein
MLGPVKGGKGLKHHEVVVDLTWRALVRFLSFRRRRKLVGKVGSGKWNAAAAGKPCSGHWEATKEKVRKETAPALDASLTKLLITFTRVMVVDEALQGTLRHRHMLVRLRRMKVLGFSDADCRSQPHCNERRMRIGSGCAYLAVVAAASPTPFED